VRYSFSNGNFAYRVIALYSAKADTNNDVFLQIMQLKDDGTCAFQKCRLDQAESLFKRGIGLYGSKLGQELVKILSNEANLDERRTLRRGGIIHHADSWHILRSRHEIFLSAKARLEIFRATRQGDTTRLKRAKRDVLLMILGVDLATRNNICALLRRIEHEIKRADKKANAKVKASYLI